MAKSTIDAIREVEKQTLEAEKQAAADARILSTKTKEDAEKLVRDTLAKAEADADAMLKEAEAKQKELVDQKSRETVKAVEDLKAAAEAKSKEAVMAILDIISG